MVSHGADELHQVPMFCSAPSFSLDILCARACSLGKVHLKASSDQVSSGAGDMLSSVLRFVDAVADPFQVLP